MDIDDPDGDINNKKFKTANRDMIEMGIQNKLNTSWTASREGDDQRAVHERANKQS